jgi:hypothetical protein
LAPQAGLVPSTARAVRRLKTAWGAIFAELSFLSER